MWLGTGVDVAVVQANGYGSDSTPSLGTSICHGCIPKKIKQTKKQKKNLSALIDSGDLLLACRSCVTFCSPFPSRFHGALQT